MDAKTKNLAILCVTLIVCFMMACLTIQGIDGAMMMGIAVVGIGLVEAIVLGVRNGIKGKKEEGD